MCGRYSIALEKENIEEAFHAKFGSAFTPRYNAAPSQMLPVFLNDQPGKIVFAKWGRDDKAARRHHQRPCRTPARQAEVPQRLLTSAVRSDRDGFYEWKATGRAKDHTASI
jgi:putative SOS response-associated peptidase YedK